MAIDKIVINPPVFDRRFDFNTEELSSLETIGRVAEQVNKIVDVINNWTDNLNLRELSDNITNNRKLSPTGNFTGTLAGRLVSLVLAEIDDNSDKIVYLANQFSDGQTGLVIDGGFFEDSGIDKNFDGGRF